MAAERIWIGIDIGGTFSDVVVVDDGGKIRVALKVPSTPEHPDAAVVTGLQRLAHEMPGLVDHALVATMFHGTTVATNALIQKRGARTALITTAGFRDVLALRRQARPDLYSLAQRISPPLVPDHWRYEVSERIGYDGTVLTALDVESLRRLCDDLAADGVEAVALCFLHSYANPVHEQLASRVLTEAHPQFDVSLSSDICPELGEFERTSTVVANAYVSPVVRTYLRRLREGVARYGVDDFNVVKSNGGLTSSANAERYPVHLIESGPAAGMSAAAELGRALGLRNLIAFDMGGTTAKIGVIHDGDPRLARELHADRYVEGRDVGGYVIKSPVIDLAEIGAGGGSIAWLDGAGILKVGPHSAGSDPGPACYGQGGEEPTVTDAQLVVGNLGVASDAFPDGLRVDLARAAIQKRIAEPLNWSVERAAHGILRIATATMAETVRLVTVRRGIDIRDFALVVSGGAGPLHAADIAAEVGISTIVVPPLPAMFSAIGTIMCDVRHDLVHSMVRELDSLDPRELAATFGLLTGRARDLLAAESVPIDESTVRYNRHLDLRHVGQLHQIDVPIDGEPDAAAIEATFRRAYRDRYGYTLPDSRVELVNARLEVVVPRWPAGAFPSGAAGDPATCEDRRTIVDSDGGADEWPVLPRHRVAGGEPLTGPLLIAESGSVLRVRPGQRVRPLAGGALVIEEPIERHEER